MKFVLIFPYILMFALYWKPFGGVPIYTWKFKISIKKNLEYSFSRDFTFHQSSLCIKGALLKIDYYINKKEDIENGRH
jgi:hypothetical protein